MFAITGITGRVGGGVARALLDAGLPVRAVVRNAASGAEWASRGCEVAIADLRDVDALIAAFAATQGVFSLIPPNFDPKPGFPEARAIVAAVKSALAVAQPEKVVCLSTIGAQATQTNLLTQLHIAEEELGELAMPICFLRPAWFLENSAWDIEPARATGTFASFLQPIERRIPMVAVGDVCRIAAHLLDERWLGKRVVELEGPRRVAPSDIAEILTRLLGRSARAEPVPRETWVSLFISQGMQNPTPRAQMLDGFNAGWIDFEYGQAISAKGTIEVETVLRNLIAQSPTA
jgi:uncharacterized protein YbjT (DUF2867 family)